MTFDSRLLRGALVIPIQAETIQTLDRRRLFALDHFASAFSARLAPDSEIGRAALAKLASHPSASPAIRRAAERGVLEDHRVGAASWRRRGELVVCLHPRDLPSALEMTERSPRADH
jgi:hypothetical protein